MRLLGDGLLELLSPGGVGRRRAQLIVAGRATFGAVLASAPPRLHGVASLEAELPDLAASLDASSRSDPTYEASAPESWGGLGAWDPAMRCSRVVLLGFDLGEQSDYDQGRASALSDADSDVACEYVTRAESFRLVCCTRARQGRMQVRAAGHVGELPWSWTELVHRPRVTAAAPSLLSTAGGQRLAIGGEGLRASSTGAYRGNRSVHYRGSQAIVLAGPLGTVAAGAYKSNDDIRAQMQPGRVTTFGAKDPPVLPILGNLSQLHRPPSSVLGDINVTDVDILTGPVLYQPVQLAMDPWSRASWEQVSRVHPSNASTGAWMCGPGADQQPCPAAKWEDVHAGQRSGVVELHPDHAREQLRLEGREGDITEWQGHVSDESAMGPAAFDGSASTWNGLVVRAPEQHGPGLEMQVAVAIMAYRGFVRSNVFWVPTEPPTISGVVPSELPVTGGVITVKGSGFGTGGEVVVLQRIAVHEPRAGVGARAAVVPEVLRAALNGLHPGPSETAGMYDPGWAVGATDGNISGATSPEIAQLFWPGAFSVGPDDDNPPTGIAVDGSGRLVRLHPEGSSQAVHGPIDDSTSMPHSMQVHTRCRVLSWRHDRIDCVAPGGLDKQARVLVSVGWTQSNEFGHLAYGPLRVPEVTPAPISVLGRSVTVQTPTLAEHLGMGLWIGALLGLLLILLLGGLAYALGCRARARIGVTVPLPAKEQGDPPVAAAKDGMADTV